MSTRSTATTTLPKFPSPPYALKPRPSSLSLTPIPMPDTSMTSATRRIWRSTRRSTTSRQRSSRWLIAANRWISTSSSASRSGTMARIGGRPKRSRVLARERERRTISDSIQSYNSWNTALIAWLREDVKSNVYKGRLLLVLDMQ